MREARVGDAVYLGDQYVGTVIAADADAGTVTTDLGPTTAPVGDVRPVLWGEDDD